STARTAGPRGPGRAGAAGTLGYGAERSGLGDMRLALAGSELTGNVAVRGESLRFDLRVNQINIDRYLPPAQETDAPAEEGSLDEVDLPLDALRTLDAQGRLAFGPTQFPGL